MRLFDSHLHLTAEAFAGDLDGVLARARAAGVGHLVTVASDPEDARRALRLVRREVGLWSTAGLHPHEAERFGPGVAEDIEALVAEPKVVAIGETGLDFHYDNASRAAQLASFEAQMDLAAGTGLPVVVHSRDADADVERLVRRWGRAVRGVLHCFTGGDGLLRAALDAGWFVSFSGIVTFRRFDGFEQVRQVPPDRLLIETDSPYLAPVPRRGRRNEPAFLTHTCEAVARIRGVPPEEIGEQTLRNAHDLYGLEGP